MWLTIVLERHLLQGSNLKIRFNAPSPGFVFQQQECTTSCQEFRWKIFYSARIMFSPQMLSTFCFLAGFSLGSRRRDPGEYRFLGGILAEIRCGNFSQKGFCWENGPPRQDPGEIPVPILQEWVYSWVDVTNFFACMFTKT